jgi:protein-S-isoprenylcysteine O-methyltransferase Ste14
MKSVLVVAAFEVVMGGILFGCAGRLDLPWFWVLLGVHTALMLFAMAMIDPGLKAERMRPGGAGIDRGFRPVLACLLLVHLVVAGLDARFGWTPVIATGPRLAALAVYLAGFGFSLWAMSANRFFSPVVRVQAERGHQVVRGGPYRFVRHPGYLGLIVSATSGAIVLGSLWALAPALPFVLVVLRRTLLEDRFLRGNLAGYSEYASAVRYRMAPGVW